MLVALGAAALSLWGVGPGSPLRQNALDFLHIKALGAPATLLLMVAQVLPLYTGQTCYCGGRQHAAEGQGLCILRRRHMVVCVDALQQHQGNSARAMQRRRRS